MTAAFYVGDAIEVMSKLPEKSVDLVLTSPPFLALRSYLPADHPDKALEGGSQSTPGEFIDWLLDVAEACNRVLAPHGSLCVELGDTYSGGEIFSTPQDRPQDDGGYSAVRYEGHGSGIRNMNQKIQPGGPAWPLAKSLSLIPESFRFAMVYGVNPHTGRTTEPWRLRNVIRWVRPNPPVGALGDKFRPATSELMVFCKSAKRYFDLDAVREPYSQASLDRFAGNSGMKFDKAANEGRGGGWSTFTEGKLTQSGAPPLDWWNIPLLEGEEETRYGPKERIDTGERRKTQTLVNNPKRGDYLQGIGEWKGPNPLGAPPLDWWKIAPDVDVDDWRKPCEHGRFTPHSVEYKQAQYEHRQYKCPGGSPVTIADLNLLSGNGETGVPLDWWNIPPGGYEGAHYAVFPPELCVKPVKAMSPEKVCRQCGEPSRRIVEANRVTVPDDGTRRKTSGNTNGWEPPPELGWEYDRTTTGWSDCGHDDWRPGLVLDPFAGSGTTLAVATGHGRDAIGIDLDERNYELALQRVGPFILERAS